MRGTGVFVALLLVGNLSQPPAPTLQQWLDAVRQHTPGEWDRPARTVGGWSSEELRALFDRLRRQRDRGPELNAVLLAGAMLQADIAILGADRVIKSSPGDRVVPFARDGRFYGIHPQEPAWALGRALLDGVTRNEASDRITLLWYRATMAYLANHGQLAEVPVHLEAGLRLFPGNASLLFDGGWLNEEYAGPRTQTSVADMQGLGPRSQRADIPDPGDALRRADEFYTRALASDPAFLEARVHRGRVRMLRGRTPAAIADLRAALAARGAPTDTYLAALFLGSAHEAAEQIEEARVAYARAAAVFPLAQSAHLALSRLAVRGGDMVTAQREVQAVLSLAPTHPDRGDPWWTYPQGSGRHADSLLAQLRAAMKPVAGS